MPSSPFPKNVKLTLANSNSQWENSSLKDSSSQKMEQTSKWESSSDAIKRVFDKYDKIYGCKQINNNNDKKEIENNLTHQMIENNQQFDEQLKNN
jgi:hypothetical protein